jgi:WD40 repeat protein
VRVQKRFWLLFFLTIAIVTAAVVGTYVSLQQVLAMRVARSVCVPVQNSTSLCFAQPEVLSSQAPTALVVHPDGRSAISSFQQTIQVWNLESGKLVRSFPAHANWVSALAISPDGQLLASSGMEGTIKIWYLSTGTLLGTMRSGRVSCLAFSPNGLSLASGSRMIHWADGAISQPGIQFWDVASQEPLQLRLGDKPVGAIAYSPDGQLIVAGRMSTDIWQLSTEQRIHILDSGELTSLLFSAEGETLVTGSSATKVWQVSSGKLIGNLKSGAADLALSPDRQLMLTAAGGAVNFWRWQTRLLLGTLRGSVYSGLVIDFALDGQAIVTGGSNGIRLWRSQAQAPTLPNI